MKYIATRIIFIINMINIIDQFEIPDDAIRVMIGVSQAVVRFHHDPAL